MKIKFATLTIILGCLFFLPKTLVAVNDESSSKEEAVYGLIKRILPAYADRFEIAFIPKEDEKDLFEIESVNGKIILRGNNGISIASALNYYLKNYAHCQITWNGTNLNVPNPLPMVPNKIRRKSPYKYRYYLNYCTFNYSMSWWDWERWQKEIDWMALNGINMPLAVTGQNSVWKRVYNKLGFSDKELESFFSGPAYFNWFWMGNLDGWGGPLPQSFMEKHEALQKNILHQERSLGMTPVLPAFTGHVPPTFQNKFPEARLSKTTWGGFPEVNILAPGEPLFTKIGQSFIEEETRVYGTDHLYSADTFNENTPPTKDSTYLNDVSRKVYQSMRQADPDATWVMQGWLFHNNTDFWGTKEIQALLNAVPNDHMIVLDLFSDLFPVWNRTEAYYGKPWIWCMLHNFGKNISLSGTMNHVSQNPSLALQDPSSKNLKGIGLTMEGIEQNPVMYDLMLENVWRDTPIDLSTWLKDYALRRYGKDNAKADKAWDLLSRSVYANTITEGGPESIISARPTFKDPGWNIQTALPYNPLDLIKAWDYMMAASGDLKNSDGFQYDIVDITRQVMANYGDIIYKRMSEDYQNKDIKAYREHSEKFIGLITDLDNLLSTRKDFLLGNWLESAKKMGTNDTESKLYEKNARDLITLWGDKNSSLSEYACKQWSGMLNGFYKVRWQKFNDRVCEALMSHKNFDEDLFDKEIKDWEWNWVNSNEIYPVKTHGNAVQTARKMYGKYYRVILNAYPE